jgi:hypothetical protein
MVGPALQILIYPATAVRSQQAEEKQARKHPWWLSEAVSKADQRSNPATTNGVASEQNRGHYYADCRDEPRATLPRREQFRGAQTKPSSIVLEPVGRHTAPAIAVGALRALRILPNALLLVLPSDHVILNEAAFARVIEAAAEVAKNDYQISAAAKPKVPRGHRLMVSTLPGYKPLLRAIRTRPQVRQRKIRSCATPPSH